LLSLKLTVVCPVNDLNSIPTQGFSKSYQYSEVALGTLGPVASLLRLPSLLQFLKQHLVNLIGTIRIIFKHENHANKHRDRNENNPASSFFHEIQSQTEILSASLPETKPAKKYEAIDAGLGALFATSY
jgi:hypothetical protein